MLPTVARIFVSSTWLDLQPERHAVEAAINRMNAGKFIGMEYFGSRPEDTRQTSLDEVDKADIYVGIIGGRYGSGITAQEYRRAREQGLPCFIYFKDDSAVNAEGRDNDDAKAAQLAALKQELSRNHIITTPFKTTAELAICVRDDLYRWFDERRARELERHALGNIAATHDDGRALRLQVGAAEGGLVYNSAPQPPRPRPTPVQLGARRFRGLLDRTAEAGAALKTLQELLPVEFYGQAGIGKTALLRHLAYQPTNGHFPDGVIYRAQVGQQPAGDLLQFIFDAFYETDQNYKPREAELLSLLRGKRGLVLLDDVELPRAELERVMNAAPDCAFLLAARERRLAGEGRALQLPGLPAAEAAQLLEHKLERVLTPEEQAAAQSICQLLAGHPLHIAQTAAIALERKLPLRELAARMQTAQTQGQSPAALLNQQLAAAGSADEKRVLAALAALRGAPVRAENLAAIAGVHDVEAVLEKMAQRELIETHADGYRLTSPLQEVVEKDWGLTEWRARALAHFTTWAEQNQRDHKRLGAASAALLTVFNWAMANDRWDEAKRLGQALEGELILSGRWEAWGQVLQQISQAAAVTGDEQTAAWVLHQQGTRALCSGDDEAARRLLAEALERRAALGDHVAASATRHNLDWLFPPLPYHPPSQAAPEPTPTPGPEPVMRPRFARWLQFGAGALLLGVGGLIATALYQPTPPLAIGFAPAQLSFAAQELNTPSAPQSVTLTNPGPESVTVNAVTLTGAAANDFAIVENNCAGARLVPQGTCRLSIAFTPRATKERSAELAVSIGAQVQPGRMKLSGQGDEAPTPPTRTPVAETSVSFNPARLAFDAREVGTTGNAAIELRNGAAPLTLTRIKIVGAEAADFAVTGDDCARDRIAAAACCTIKLSFTPSGEGERNASLQIAGNLSGGAQTIALSGTGTPRPPSAPVLRPPALNFGEVEMGQRAQQTITVTNNSNAPLKISNVALNGAAADFGLVATDCRNATLARGAGCTVRVSFAPRAPGGRSAQLTLSDNTPAGAQTVPLSGTGIGVPRLTLSRTSVAFGEQPLRATGQSQSVTITNTGSGALLIESVRSTGSIRDFVVDAGACANARLEPNRAGCTINIRFEPRALGERSASLLIAHNAAASPHSVALTGSGAQPPMARINLSADSLSFGEQAAGTRPRAQSVRVTNTGTATLNLNNMDAAALKHFTVRENCSGAQLAPEQSGCAISVSFTPRASGEFREELVITGNADNSPARVTLTGSVKFERPTPVKLSININPTNLQFGSSKKKDATGYVTVTNDGNGALTVNRAEITGADANNFRLKSQCEGTSLNPGQSCAIEVRFNAKDKTGGGRAELVIYHNADNRPRSVALNAAAIDKPDKPDQPPQSDDKPPRSKVSFRLEPGGLNFGSLPVGVPSKPQSATLRNTGDAPITITRVAVTEGLLGGLLEGLSRGRYGSQSGINFEITNDGCTRRTLNPNETCSISVRFTPRAAGRRVNGSLVAHVDKVNTTASLSGAAQGEATGYCCIGNGVVRLTREQCQQRQGKYYESERDAGQACAPILRRTTPTPPVIR